MPPGNASFETARNVEVGADGILQPVPGATQVDYFSFEAEAGVFYAIWTNRNRFTPNNVLTIYDAEGERMAENDYGARWPGDEIDARIVTRFSRAGTYYAVAEDRTTPEGYFADPEAPLLFYRFTVQALSEAPQGGHFDTELAKDAVPIELGEDVATGYGFATIVGSLHENDVDVFSLSGRRDHALLVNVLPAGRDGNGSTVERGLIDLTDAAFTPLALIDRALGQRQIHPPVVDASYRLNLRADGEIGDNGFYAIDITLVPDNPAEQADAENDTLEGAETIMMEGAFSRRGVLLSQLPPLDVDYYRLDATAGEEIRILCQSASVGSGVLGLRAELRDADDNMLVAANETLTDALRTEPFIVDRDDSYYVRLSSEPEHSGAAAADWTRCAIDASP